MMIDYLAGQRKVKKFAALYQDDEYGKSFLTAFERISGATASAGRGPIGQPWSHDVERPGREAQGAKPEVTFLGWCRARARKALKEALRRSAGPTHAWSRRAR